MQFAILCFDKPGHGHVRQENRSAHLAYLDEHKASLVLAGPMLTDDGEGMAGSLLIMEFADKAAAEAFAAGDPYARAGLFESVTIRPFRKVLPAS